MPNYVRNIVTFQGSKEALRIVRDGVKNFDFNKICPKPSETLNVVAGGISDAAMGAYMYSLYKDKFEKMLAFMNDFPLYVDETKKESVCGGSFQEVLERFSVKGEPFGDPQTNPDKLISVRSCACKGDVIAYGKKMLKDTPFAALGTPIHSWSFEGKDVSQHLYAHVVKAASSEIANDMVFIAMVYVHYYREIKDGLGFIENLPKIGDEGWLGSESEDLSYLYNGNSEDPKYKADVVALGRILYTNILLYYAKDWYDWNCLNWGTKWGAMEVTVLEDTDNSLVYSFDTAWAMPYYIFKKLANMINYAGASMDWKYADEDMGNNCGYITMDGKGNIKEVELEDDVDFASDVWNYC